VRTPSVGLTFADVAGIAHSEPTALPPGMAPGLEASARYTAESASIWANATHVGTCEVALIEGAVRGTRAR